MTRIGSRVATPETPAISGGLAANASAFVAAVLYGASVVAVRVAVVEVPPLSLAVLRFAQGALILIVVLAVTGRLGLPRRDDLRWIALLGIIFYSLFPASFNFGLRFTEATRGALMLATMPIWSVWLGRVLAEERLTTKQVAGVVLTSVGVAASLVERGLELEGGLTPLIGDGLVLTTAFLGALYGALSKRVLKRMGPMMLTTWAMTIGTLLLVPLALAEGLLDAIPAMSTTTLWTVAFLGVLGGAVAFSLWTWALSRLPPTQVAVYVNLNPMAATLLAVLLLDESITPLFAFSFGLVLVGVYLANRKQTSRGARAVRDPTRTV